MNALPPEYLDKRKVAQSFDRVAPTYEPLANVQKLVEDELLERLQWLKIAPQQILDVGAGAGRLTRALSEQYNPAQLYCLDISIKMSQLARNKAHRWPSKPHFICADAAQLPIADESIDLLVSNLMLQWCNDIQAVFAEFARVLKPEGALFFSTFGPDTLTELRHSWASVDNASHLNRFIDMHDLGDALLQAGLSNPVMDVDWLQFTYSDAKQLMTELKSIGAHNLTAGRPRGLMGKNKFKAMLAAYEQYRSTEGWLPATYEVVYGHALGKQPIEPFAPSSGTVAIPISQIGRPR
jgi:malonyl-CoA O-methyltransferase